MLSPPLQISAITTKASSGLAAVSQHLSTITAKLEKYDSELAPLDTKYESVEAWRTALGNLKADATATFTSAIGDLNSSLVSMTPPPSTLLPLTSDLCSRTLAALVKSHDAFHVHLFRVSVLQTSSSYAGNQLSLCASSLAEIRRQLQGEFY